MVIAAGSRVFWTASLLTGIDWDLLLMSISSSVEDGLDHWDGDVSLQSLAGKE